MIERLLILAAFAALPGCVMQMRVPMRDLNLEDIQARASNEFRCPVQQVAVEALGASSYRAYACGYQATYVCVGLGTCVRESVGAAQPQQQYGGY